MDMAAMAWQKIPCDSLQAMLTYLTNELPSLSFDERVERLRKFLATLERYRAKYRDAADAAAQTAAAQDFSGVREWQLLLAR